MEKTGIKEDITEMFFFSAFIILIILDVLLLWVSFVPGANDMFNDDIHSIFGYLSGKTVGQLLALPLFALIYVIVSKTVGSDQNFKKHVEAFSQLPEAVKAKANKKLLIPFFLLLTILFVVAMSSLWRN